MPPSVGARTFLTFAPEAVQRLRSLLGDAEDAISRAEEVLGTVQWQSDVDVALFAVTDPFRAAVALALVSDQPPSIAGARVSQVLPELLGLAVPSEATTYEHEASTHGGRATPLLDRVLRALELAIPLTADADAETRSLVAATLLFSDVAKGGTPQQREGWRVRLGVDGTVHNEDSAVIFEDVVRRVLGKAQLSNDGRWADRVSALCAASGLLGMRLRGEVGRDALAGFHEMVKKETDPGGRLAKVWSIVNRCETAAVRSDLWTDELARTFVDEERSILRMSTSRDLARGNLADRIARMRGGALLRAETIGAVEEALEGLRGGRASLESRLLHCRVWYAEPTIAALSLEASLRLLLHLVGAAHKASIDTTRAWHLDLLALVPELRDRAGAPRRYPVRLLETLLLATKVEDLVVGKLEGGALISLGSTKGGEEALAVHFSKTEEAAALLTLLGIYERKASAAFHATLKSLCDLYGLRKDDYDRVNNEIAYLATMNAAKSDKARMLELVKPGVIVEIGPGGGVVLDLIAERFPSSRVVGLDASEAVVDAHVARMAHREAPYEMIHGDAFELPTIFGAGEVDTVVFCSVLHEIFSYVKWGDPPARFRIEAVVAVVVAAFKTLKVGGRILVRDGVAPADEPRVIEFVDPTWKDGLDLFAKSYEPRAIPFETLADGRVRMSQPDLYEFLTTYTWGPDSFPYEIREQRAVLPRAAYVECLLAACRAAEPGRSAVEVAVPPDLATYLQPGYPENIRPHLKIYDASGNTEVPMPDVNGVWVIQKT